MQSEIANLAGSLTGHGAIQAGATTDGPSNIGNFVGLGTVTGMRAWPSVEPSDDYSAISTLAFALAAAAR